MRSGLGPAAILGAKHGGLIPAAPLWVGRGGSGGSRGPCPTRGRRVTPGCAEADTGGVCMGPCLCRQSCGVWAPAVGTDWGGKEGRVGRGKCTTKCTHGPGPRAVRQTHSTRRPRLSGLDRGQPRPRPLAQGWAPSSWERGAASGEAFPRGGPSAPPSGEQRRSSVGVGRGSPGLEGWVPRPRCTQRRGHRQGEGAQQHQSHREDTRGGRDEGPEPGLCPRPGSVSPWGSWRVVGKGGRAGGGEGADGLWGDYTYHSFLEMKDPSF